MTAKLLIPGPAGNLEALLMGILADALTEAGMATLRFNFRGVGASDGEQTGGAGELDDLLAVVEWVRSNRSEPLVLGGYSFGAAVVTRALPASGALRAFLVAPPAGNLATLAPDGSVPVDVFVGGRDAFVNEDALAGWSNANIHRIEPADHFFSGCTGDLASAIRQALADDPVGR